jgi:hypothetical protein
MMEGDSNRRGEEQKRFDLEDRTAKFGETVVSFAKKIPVSLVTQPMIPQLVRTATIAMARGKGTASDLRGDPSWKETDR